MDEQFGGRTDDDLFADDFEPVQPPAPSLVVPDPVSVAPVASALATQPANDQPAPATQPQKGSAKTGTDTPTSGGNSRRNRQSKPRTSNGAQKATPASGAAASPAVATTPSLVNTPEPPKAAAAPPPPSLAQSRHNRPPTPPAAAAQPIPTTTSTPAPATSGDSTSPTPPSGSAGNAPAQQQTGPKPRRDKNRRGGGHAQGKDASGKGSPAPGGNNNNNNKNGQAANGEQQPVAQKQQHQKQPKQPKQQQQQTPNAPKAGKDETATGTATPPTAAKAARNGKGGNNGADATNSTPPPNGAGHGPNARTQSGANPRTRLTEAELETKMSAMRLAAEEKTRRFEQAQRDERDHDLAIQKGREEARKRKAAEDEKRKRSEEDRRRLEEERARNRDRKLKAMGVKEGNWDEGKDKEGGAPATGGGIRGSRHAAGILPIANASVVTAKQEPNHNNSNNTNGGGRGGRRGRGERGGRGGRGGNGGGGRNSGGRIQFNDAGSIGADIAEWVHGTAEPSTMVPPSPGPSDSNFPSLPGGKEDGAGETTAAANGQSYAAKAAADKTTAPRADTKPTETKKGPVKLSLPPLPSMPAVGAWDEEVEEATRNGTV
ncbi:hypothetical protein SEUCBS140593_001619 [Sporothrix eucalyptigena]|uniref:Uncharacterized protein n=1 Tax=Sporothrix eucalyptigena TaxID=1812306 RepID=A0ABP0AZR4_9PEZI